MADATSRFAENPLGDSEELSLFDFSLQSFLELTKVITRLGVSLGGIAVVFGIFGFLIYYAHDLMLGIEVGLRDPLEYILTGWFFIPYSLYVGGLKSGINIEFLISILAFGLLLLTHNKSRLKEFTDQYSLKNITTDKLQFAGISILLLLQLVNMRRIYSLLSNGSYLLYKMPTLQINKYLVEGDITPLRHQYASLLLPTVISIIAICYFHLTLSHRRGKGRGRKYPGRLLATLTFTTCMVVVISIFTLPLSYGVLIMRNDYPAVKAYGIQKDNDPFNSINLSKDHEKPTLFLLEQNNREFVFYNKSAFQVIYVRRDCVNYVTTERRFNIFSGRDLTSQ